jgi:hypothetical protein
MNQNCPMVGEPCVGCKCVAYCSALRKKIYKKEIKLETCNECEKYLIPYAGAWLHPNNDCAYANMIEVTIKQHAPDYEEELGTPDHEYQDLIESLTTEPKSWWKRLQESAIHTLKKKMHK